MRNCFKRIATAALATLVLSSSAIASPLGVWQRTSTGGEIEAFDCGGGIGLKVVKSTDAAKVGKQIMCGAKPAGENRWEGTILNLEDGKEYKGVITLSNNALKLSGCVLGGLICKTENWARK